MWFNVYKSWYVTEWQKQITPRKQWYVIDSVVGSRHYIYYWQRASAMSCSFMLRGLVGDVSWIRTLVSFSVSILRFIWYSHSIYDIFKAQTVSFTPGQHLPISWMLLCVFSIKEIQFSTFIWKRNGTFFPADCQKHFVIVLPHCDTNSFCLMLKNISNRLLNIMCTSIFIHWMHTRIAGFFSSGKYCSFEESRYNCFLKHHSTDLAVSR